MDDTVEGWIHRNRWRSPSPPKRPPPSPPTWSARRGVSFSGEASQRPHQPPASSPLLVHYLQAAATRALDENYFHFLVSGSAGAVHGGGRPAREYPCQGTPKWHSPIPSFDLLVSSALSSMGVCAGVWRARSCRSSHFLMSTEVNLVFLFVTSESGNEHISVH
jgi:hypothetical protein